MAILLDTTGEPFPPSPKPKPTWPERLRGLWTHWLAGAVGGLCLLVAGPLVDKTAEWLFAGEFEIHSVLLPDENTGQERLRITMVNNSDEVVFVHRVDFLVSASGTVHDDFYVTRVVTTSARYQVQLPDVLPDEPRLAILHLSHSVAPQEEDQIEVTLLHPLSISVTGTYTLEPKVLVLGDTHDLEPITIDVVSNRVAVERDDNEGTPSVPYIPTQPDFYPPAPNQ